MNQHWKGISTQHSTKNAGWEVLRFKIVNSSFYIQDFLVASHTVSVKLTKNSVNTSNEFSTDSTNENTPPSVTTDTEVPESFTEKVFPILASAPSPPKDYPSPPSPPTPGPQTFRPQQAVDPPIVRPDSEKFPTKDTIVTRTETVTKESNVSKLQKMSKN